MEVVTVEGFELGKGRGGGHCTTCALVRDPHFGWEGMEMDDTRMRMLLVVVAQLVVGLIGFVRGPDHRRGQQLGARAFGDDAHPASVAVA